jgi:hypothetical protein
VLSAPVGRDERCYDIGYSVGLCAPKSNPVGAGIAQYALRCRRSEVIANTPFQARANKNSTGDLQRKLDAQKKLTNTKQLQAAAEANLAHRVADANTRAAQHH